MLALLYCILLLFLDLVGGGSNNICCELLLQRPHVFFIVAVSRSYIWAYASFQFAIVILFAHVLYTVVSVSRVLLSMLYPIIFFIWEGALKGTSGLYFSYTLQLNVNPILSVLLSSFTGFGIAISTNSLLVEYLRWRTSRQRRFSRQHVNTPVQQQQLQMQQLGNWWQLEHHQEQQQEPEQRQRPQEQEQGHIAATSSNN